ncbi:hypothetical protein P879_03543 [Paragonimus westermani]|uniref:UPF0506 domain-containing protein n=1 Tax=Paragonimus westermani TaxID=34504 RepID=A0A8T0DK58_9TREM|nr:hypothetical protein P879_03543 [Paragonimus westermani]
MFERSYHILIPCIFALTTVIPLGTGCGLLNDTCSRFYEDRKPCCFPYKCQQVDENVGRCVTCIVRDEFCVGSIECCSQSCVGYLCQ